MTMKEICELTGRSDSTIHRLVTTGKLTGRKEPSPNGGMPTWYVEGTPEEIKAVVEANLTRPYTPRPRRDQSTPVGEIKDRLHSSSEVGRLFGVSPSTVAKFAVEQHIGQIGPGGARYFSRAEVEKFKAKYRPVTAQAATSNGADYTVLLKRLDRIESQLIEAKAANSVLLAQVTALKELWEK